MKKSRREKIVAAVRNRLGTLQQPVLSEDIAGVACWSCGEIVNCAECAERRRQIDTFADRRPLGPNEIRENVRRSWR